MSNVSPNHPMTWDSSAGPTGLTKVAHTVASPTGTRSRNALAARSLLSRPANIQRNQKRYADSQQRAFALAPEPRQHQRERQSDDGTVEKHWSRQAQQPVAGRACNLREPLVGNECLAEHSE